MEPAFNPNWMRCFGLMVLLFGCTYQRATADDFHVSVIGDTIDVWSSVDTLKKCKIIDVPDIPARAFIDGDGLAHVIDGSTDFHTMNGPSILNVTRSCNVSWNMTGDPDPAMFAGDEFLDSTVAFSNNGTVISLVHTEFPGNRFDGCSGPAYPYCWTVTIGLAISDYWGKTWRHARPPPHHLVAAVPYTYNETHLAYGWGDPSNIIRNRKDGYYYFAMWNRNRVGEQEAGTCIVRTKNLMDPSSWRGWNGKSFNVTFVSPYGKGNDASPAAVEGHICTVVTNMPPTCAALGLSWSTYLEKFVATLGCFGKMSKAFYITTSDDMIHWEELQLLFSLQDISPDVRKMVSSIHYPTFLDPSAGDPNFGTIGREPFLYWVSIGHSPYTDGRHLWATPMKFSTLNFSEQGGRVNTPKEMKA